MGVPVGLSDIVAERKRRFGSDLVEFSRLAGTPITKADQSHIEKWDGKGCMAGMEALENYLELMGYEITFHRKKGHIR